MKALNSTASAKVKEAGNEYPRLTKRYPEEDTYLFFFL